MSTRGALPEGQAVTLQGTVRGYRERAEQEQWGNGSQSFTTVVFRLDTFDEAGNRIGAFPVQLRGEGFTGQLTDSDEVRLDGTVRGGVVHADRVQDVQTGALFQLSPYSRKRAAQRGTTGCFTTLFLLVALWIVVIFGCVVACVVVVVTVVVPQVVKIVGVVESGIPQLTPHAAVTPDGGEP